MKDYRATWSTHAMLELMYTLIYKKFEEWGHAVPLPEPQWQDANGKEVPKEDALGY